MNQYYTATEAAAILGLKYSTFMARVKRGWYTFDRVGNWTTVFDKDYIDRLAAEGKQTCS